MAEFSTSNVLVLSDEELYTLRCILTHVGGSPKNSLRRHADSITAAIDSQVNDSFSSAWDERESFMIGGIHFNDHTS